MIINWFTQPPKAFASYYQYDTVTKKFCRIRLELGRTDGSGKAKAMYEPKRAVGFSRDDNYKSDRLRWSAGNDGTLSYDGTALRNKPVAGDWVYDTSIPNRSAHCGNQIPSDPPDLPPGIEPKHLALIANEAMLRGQEIELAPGTVSADELATAIKGKVCDIVGVGRNSFGAIDDAAISRTLVSQAKGISRDTAGRSVSDLDGALAEVQKISLQLENGQFTPTEESQVAFVSLKSALNDAQAAGGNSNVQRALDEIGKAQRAVETMLKDSAIIQNEDMSRQLDLATKSLEQAQRNATEWRTVETTDYKSITEATSVDDYMSAMEDA